MHPAVCPATVVEPLGVYEGNRGEVPAPHGLEQSQRQPAHRPPADHLRTELVQMARQCTVIVAREIEASAEAQPLEPPIAERPRPAQLAVNVLFVLRTG